ncbi:hypothetical protein MCAP1_002984 [Malassezia caprae]|uniref:Uncharacterized protein n=1 Tax=Malassezia caprae TaxID=1381934 RepID=A0AAF0EDT4_9BASI|nr:hypothetical protein MCAP1_002984 [Malassezia caprae]
MRSEAKKYPMQQRLEKEFPDRRRNVTPSIVIDQVNVEATDEDLERKANSSSGSQLWQFETLSASLFFVKTEEDSKAVAILANQTQYNEHLKASKKKPRRFPAAFRHIKDDVDPSSSIEQGYFPSDEERKMLRRVPEKLNWATFCIGICELAERFSFYGATQVFSNYVNRERPVIDGQLSTTGAAKHLSTPSGALGLGTQVANGLVTFNQFWCYITPLLGAYVADVYTNRFNALCIGVGFSMLGHILLVISAIPSVLDNSHGALACFIIAMIIMGFGTGFFKSNCSVLIADQIRFKQQTVVTLPSGEKVIIDPALTLQRLYLWFYLMINIGSCAGELGMVYAEKWVGFWLAYLLPTLVFTIPIPVLWFGRNFYDVVPPNGSVLSQALKACGLVVRKNWSWNPVRLMRNVQSSTYWDCAKPSMLSESERKPWMAYEDVWIDELRRGVKACAVFLLFPLYWLCYNQIVNNLIVQAGQMDIGSTPSEIVSVLDPIFVIIFVFVFNTGIYPLMARIKLPFTPIKRITVGFFFASAGMIWAAVLQHYIYTSNPCGDQVGDSTIVNGVHCSRAYSSISVWTQAGSYALVAVSEILASVTSLEIAVLMAPNNMRSIIMGVGLFTTAFASAIGEAFTPLSVNPMFVINYAVLAGLAFLGGILFWIFFYRLDREQEKLNLIGQEGYNEAKEDSFSGREPSISAMEKPHTDLHP